MFIVNSLKGAVLQSSAKIGRYQILSNRDSDLQNRAAFYKTIYLGPTAHEVRRFLN